MEQKVPITSHFENQNEVGPPINKWDQTKPEQEDFAQFGTSIVKEELILEDEVLPMSEPSSPQQNTIITASGYEITIKNEPPDAKDLDEPSHIPTAVKEEPSQVRTKKTAAALRCGKCKKHFRLVKSYQMHCLRHRNIERRRFVCKPCRKPFGVKRELTRHERFIHGLGRSEADRLCKICGQLCDSTESFREHMKAHRNLKKELYKCDKCGKCFCYARNFRNHVTSKMCENMPTILPEEDGTFKCSSCGKTFSKRNLIDRHIRRHMARGYLRDETVDLTERKATEAGTTPLVVENDGIRQFQCPICLKVFPRRYYCSNHIYRHVAIAKLTFQCETCKLYLGNSKELARHEFQKHGKAIRSESATTEGTVETDDRGRFKCSECKKTFSQQRLARRHMRRHKALDEGAFQCKVCGKFFGTNAEMKKHALEKHNETLTVPKVDPLDRDADGRFKCPKCPVTFVRRAQCSAHIRRHKILDSATYQCKKCLKCFARPKELEIHEKAASKESKSQCAKYQKLLKLDTKKSNQECREHKVLEENGTFICSSCSMIFLQRRFCVAHIRRHVDIDRGRFKCETCGVHCGTNKELRRHEAQKHGAIVESKRPDPIVVEQDSSGCFKCPDCTHTFLLKLTCIKHMRRHEIVRSGKFKCPLEACGLSFASNFELKRHSSVHKTEHPVKPSSSKSNQQNKEKSEKEK